MEIEKEVIQICDRILALKIICTASEYTTQLEYLESAIRKWREEAVNAHPSSEIERKASNRVLDNASAENPGLHHAAALKKATSVVQRDNVYVPAPLEADRGTVSNETEEVNWDQYIRQDMHSSAGYVDLNVNPTHLTVGTSSVSADADTSAATESSSLGLHSQPDESEHGAVGSNGNLDDLFLPGAQVSPPISAPNDRVTNAAQESSDGHAQLGTPSGNGEPSPSVSTMSSDPTISDEHDSQSAVDESSGLPHPRKAEDLTFSEDLSLSHPTKASDPIVASDPRSESPIERHSSPPSTPSLMSSEALSPPSPKDQTDRKEPSAAITPEPTASEGHSSPPSTKAPSLAASKGSSPPGPKDQADAKEPSAAVLPEPAASSTVPKPTVSDELRSPSLPDATMGVESGELGSSLPTKGLDPIVSEAPSPADTTMSNSSGQSADPTFVIDKLISKAIFEFGRTGMKFPGSEYHTEIRAEEMEYFLGRFRPGQRLTTSIINPLVSSFRWEITDLVLHSSKLDVDQPSKCGPWIIGEEYKRIIIPSCHQEHWTLFDIDLHAKVVRQYNSLKPIVLSSSLREALRNGLSKRYQASPGQPDWRFEDGVSAQQNNPDDCGIYTIQNAEILSEAPQARSCEEDPDRLRSLYLGKLIDFAERSKQNRCFRGLVRDEKPFMKRLCPSELSVLSEVPGKRRCKDWQSSTIVKADWEQERETLTKSISNGSSDKIMSRKRAEHLLTMIDAIACKDVLDAWKNTPREPNQSESQDRLPSVAQAIHNLVNRSQSRSFRDIVLLRIGKYLLASQILDQVNRLRSEGSPSKQRVATAGSSGEGNAVSRALRAFVREVYPDIAGPFEDYEIRKCKHWWEDGKIWKLLADAVNPAVLLLIPSGHKGSDDNRIWDTEYVAPVQWSRV
ncbi:MAG: hypothetical protein Q9209_007157 [Squamulea sp. 1 TL-2023]